MEKIEKAPDDFKLLCFRCKTNPIEGSIMSEDNKRYLALLCEVCKKEAGENYLR